MRKHDYGEQGLSYVFNLDEEGKVRNGTVTSPGRITAPAKEEQEYLVASDIF